MSEKTQLETEPSNISNVSCDNEHEPKTSIIESDENNITAATIMNGEQLNSNDVIVISGTNINDIYPNGASYVPQIPNHKLVIDPELELKVDTLQQQLNKILLNLNNRVHVDDFENQKNEMITVMSELDNLKRLFTSNIIDDLKSRVLKMELVQNESKTLLLQKDNKFVTMEQFALLGQAVKQLDQKIISSIDNVQEKEDITTLKQNIQKALNVVSENLNNHKQQLQTLTTAHSQLQQQLQNMKQQFLQSITQSVQPLSPVQPPVQPVQPPVQPVQPPVQPVQLPVQPSVQPVYNQNNLLDLLNKLSAGKDLKQELKLQQQELINAHASVQSQQNLENIKKTEQFENLKIKNNIPEPIEEQSVKNLLHNDSKRTISNEKMITPATIPFGLTRQVQTPFVQNQTRMSQQQLNVRNAQMMTRTAGISTPFNRY
jgi:hypothetical protein